MNLATLNIRRSEAAEAVRRYRAIVRENRSTKEDREILRGYNAILKGWKLISLPNVIKAGGADEKHRPRLAIMRADQPICHVRAWGDGSLRFGVRRWPNPGERSRSMMIEFPADTLPRSSFGMVEAQSIVPIIPPQHRPTDALSNYHILWEATWQDVPVDPALLKHLGGDLYAILAMWDLTELERAVLGRRRL